MSSRQNPLLGFACLPLLSLLAASLSAAGTAPLRPDFTGVWEPIDPPLALRTRQGNEPPLLPAPKQLYEQRIALLNRGEVAFDATRTKCAAPGEPRILTERMPFDIFQTMHTLLIGFQWNRLVRQIDLDTPLEVISPYSFGTSVGHIAGGVLSVDTQGLSEETFLDRSGLPHSSELRLSERFRLLAGGQRLQIRIRFEDPLTFSAPWETVLEFRRLPGVRIAEDICTLRRHLVPEGLQFFDPVSGAAPR
jgi:hypothetical protein